MSVRPHVLRFLHWHRYRDPDLDAAIEQLLHDRHDLDDEAFLERLELLLERFERHLKKRRPRSLN